MDKGMYCYSHIAHVKVSDTKEFVPHQLDQHLEKVSCLAKEKASVFEASEWAKIAGFWHDLGKYSAGFQSYIKSASGYDTEVHIETAPGKVNHSDAGAQLKRSAKTLFGSFQPSTTRGMLNEFRHL